MHLAGGPDAIIGIASNGRIMTFKSEAENSGKGLAEVCQFSEERVVVKLIKLNKLDKQKSIEMKREDAMKFIVLRTMLWPPGKQHDPQYTDANTELDMAFLLDVLDNKVVGERLETAFTSLILILNGKFPDEGATGQLALMDQLCDVLGLERGLGDYLHHTRNIRPPPCTFKWAQEKDYVASVAANQPQRFTPLMQPSNELTIPKDCWRVESMEIKGVSTIAADQFCFLFQVSHSLLCVHLLVSWLLDWSHQ